MRDRGGDITEMKPLCVLDFYVDAGVQRGGHGKHLFDTMLAHCGVAPAKLAYDRPSPKLKAFLAKYFSLTRYVEQNNNYIVFDDYYATQASSGMQAHQPSVSVTTATARMANQAETSTFYRSPPGSQQPALATQSTTWIVS